MSLPTASSVFFEQAKEWMDLARPLLPMYLHMLLSVLFPIFCGAHASLSRPTSAAEPAKRPSDSLSEDQDEDDEEDKVHKMEGLSASDAIVFPVTASCVLAGLYFLITRYGPDMINLIMGWYFAVIGLFSVANLATDAMSLMETLVFPEYYYDAGRIWRVTSERSALVISGTGSDQDTRHSPLAGMLGRIHLPGFVSSFLWAIREQCRQKFVVKGFVRNLIDFRAVITRLNVLSSALAIAVIAYSVLINTPWWLTNLQGFALCYGALQFMSPTSFKVGSLVLAGLFFYDIWAVFFTPLMTTVATNLDVPVKLVFPRPDVPSPVPGEPPIKSYSMIGLGDIVLPGMAIGLALRFDLYMYYLKKQQKPTGEKTTQKSKSKADSVDKAPYTSVTRRWGDKIWTMGAAPSSRPSKLQWSFPKPYFVASMVGYVAGLVATFMVVTVWNHAQPALLYLVPGVLVSTWSTAFFRGEFKQMWDFSEETSLDQILEDVVGQGDPSTASKEHESPKQESWLGWISSELWRELTGHYPEEPNQNNKAASDAQKSETGSTEADGATKSTKKDTEDSLVFSLTVRRKIPRKGTQNDGAQRKDGETSTKSNETSS